jgi:hypothetical protein
LRSYLFLLGPAGLGVTALAVLRERQTKQFAYSSALVISIGSAAREYAKYEM